MLLVAGGEATYLCHWMRASPGWPTCCRHSPRPWVGVSAGSMVMTPRIGDDFVRWPSAPGRPRPRRRTDFDLPHLDVFPENTWPRRSAGRPASALPAHVLDDDSAVTVSGSTVEVVSGQWHHLPGIAAAPDRQHERPRGPVRVSAGQALFSAPGWTQTTTLR